MRSFGRTGGRPLSARQQELIERLLPTIEAPAADAGACDPASLFEPAAGEVWLEIGFGGGEHLAGQAARRADVGFIGVEPYLDGVAKALTAIDRDGLKNVRLRRDDARAVMSGLKTASLDRIYILFPDPWRKARHHKRRLIQPDFIDELARLLRLGGEVRFATDWTDYANWTLERFLASSAFRWPATRAADWTRPPADHVATRYQIKNMGDCAPVFFTFIRR